MEQQQLRLSPPWVSYYHELQCLFADDPEVRVAFDQQEMLIKIFVDNEAKAEALDQLLEHELNFGDNIKLTVSIVPGNKPGDKYVNPYATAFSGNDALYDTNYVHTPFGDFTYVIWDTEPVQFYDDNLQDYQGKRTMLLEDVARDVMKFGQGVCHCSRETRIFDARKQWP